MSLASRLSAFFLGALGVVLVGFSASLYILASQHLHRQLDERLDASLATLVAAAEVGPVGVEWEPDERVLTLGREPGADQVRWVVSDDGGHTIDRSANLNTRRLSAQTLPQVANGRVVGRDGRGWLAKTRRLVSRVPVAESDRTAGGPLLYPALVLTAYAPLGPTEATLRSLAATLAGLSSATWLLAAAAGRRLCRRALRPLATMAAAARDADADDPASCLPLPETGDELDDLGLAFNGLLDRQHETMDRLHVALERQRRFTGEASHQLRTPLTGLIAQVDVALRRERPPEEYRRVLGVVRDKAADLHHIVESLLYLARADAEAELPELEVVDLATWLPEHVQHWAAHPRGTDLRLAPIAEAPLPVRVQPALFSQLVDNLIENACKYSRPGTPVEIRTGRTNDAVVIAVRDRGHGLTPEELDQVFTPFYRSPQARRWGQAGVGLGLSVARRIATAFGGSIQASSEPGVGSCFEIRLPGHPATPGASHVDRGPSTNRSPLPPGEG